jgi:hypothetical protein
MKKLCSTYQDIARDDVFGGMLAGVTVPNDCTGWRGQVAQLL